MQREPTVAQPPQVPLHQPWLPEDVARCAGADRDECRTCLRYLASGGRMSVLPTQLDGPCPMRIADQWSLLSAATENGGRPSASAFGPGPISPRDALRHAAMVELQPFGWHPVPHGGGSSNSTRMGDNAS